MVKFYLRYAKKKSNKTSRSVRERDILRKLNSPFIVGFVDYFEEDIIYSNIVLEYCEVKIYSDKAFM